MVALPRFIRILLRLAVGGAALLVLLVAGSNVLVLYIAREHTFTRASEVPATPAALVLGTSPRTGSAPNRFFEGRMNAAAALWKAGKVRHFLLSGDNGTRGYDEPTAMKEALMKRGVPDGALHLDYAGFRTLDSMARARAVFGLKKVVIVTDDFHLPRSLFLAQAHGLEAVGFYSAKVPWRFSLKTRTREILSRVAAVADVYVLHREPRFYGPKVALPISADS